MILPTQFLETVVFALSSGPTTGVVEKLGFVSSLFLHNVRKGLTPFLASLGDCYGLFCQWILCSRLNIYKTKQSSLCWLYLYFINSLFNLFYCIMLKLCFSHSCTLNIYWQRILLSSSSSYSSWSNIHSASSSWPRLRRISVLKLLSVVQECNSVYIFIHRDSHSKLLNVLISLAISQQQKTYFRLKYKTQNILTWSC